MLKTEKSYRLVLELTRRLFAFLLKSIRSIIHLHARIGQKDYRNLIVLIIAEAFSLLILTALVDIQLRNYLKPSQEELKKEIEERLRLLEDENYKKKISLYLGITFVQAQEGVKLSQTSGNEPQGIPDHLEDLTPYFEPLNKYLEKKKSPLSDQGENFVRIGRQYNIDPDLLIAISGAETSFGKRISRRSKYNIGNVGAFDSTKTTYHFQNYKEGIEAIAQTLNNDKLKNKQTVGELSRGGGGKGKVFAESKYNWNKNVLNYLSEIKGQKIDKNYHFRLK